jgi:hypothetical protein
MTRGGLPHSETAGSPHARCSPARFAACRVLPRPARAVRHPSSARFVSAAHRHATLPRGYSAVHQTAMVGSCADPRRTHAAVYSMSATSSLRPCSLSSSVARSWCDAPVRARRSPRRPQHVLRNDLDSLLLTRTLLLIALYLSRCAFHSEVLEGPAQPATIVDGCTCWMHTIRPAAHHTPASSYAPWLRGMDSNHRPSGYEPDELPLLHPATF